MRKINLQDQTPYQLAHTIRVFEYRLKEDCSEARRLLELRSDGNPQKWLDMVFDMDRFVGYFDNAELAIIAATLYMNGRDNEGKTCAMNLEFWVGKRAYEIIDEILKDVLSWQP